MDLILWRHAEAEDDAPGGDLERALTKRGRKQAERMAQWLRPRLDGDWRVLASPARRAVQTARPLDLDCEVRAALAPGAPARAVLVEAGWPDTARNVLVVAHQPTLGQVAARLLGTEAGDLAVRKGAIWWFAARERGAGRQTVLKAVLDPDLLG